MIKTMEKLQFAFILLQGRPKKKKENNEAKQEIDKRQWFNLQRALQMLTLICEKGSLALRYKTGQKSNMMEETTKTKKTEETRKLKQKLKRFEEILKLQRKEIISFNKQQYLGQIIDNDGIIEDMDKIYKYLDKECQVSFILILRNYQEQQDQNSQVLVKEIVKKIVEQKESHQMLLNLALIKQTLRMVQNIYSSWYEKKLNIKANTTTRLQLQYEVKEKWINYETKIIEWLIAFVEKIVAIFKTDHQ